MRTCFSRWIFLGSLLLGVSSCVTPSQTITGPDGTPHELVTCQSIEHCYAQAREACGGNYKVINSTSETMSDGSPTPNVYTTTKLLVKCEKSK